ncbi:hypothetical protein GALMADRAFT_139720 [Galerina marginata CBS 339.88]|uniref:Uncharacterized protein n=1 Tax=Galerina marginata (strain CBS 339.88) TaxID=685588 RepID=A0A067TAD5_GALM3|nr:hypothetical protein GALMADRAFT_139720 [Galerina marginata CBS 339.88]
MITTRRNGSSLRTVNWHSYYGEPLFLSRPPSFRPYKNHESTEFARSTKKWNDDNAARAKEAMLHIAAMWEDALENPKPGHDAKSRNSKAPTEADDNEEE